MRETHGAHVWDQTRSVRNSNAARNVMRDTNVRVIQAGNRLRFPFESLLPHRVIRNLRRQNFDRDRSLQLRVPRAIHLPIPPAPSGA